VVASRVDHEKKDYNPTKFLNDYASIYVPKWWQVESRISYKQKEHDINYGNSNGIMNYEDAILALQNAYIHKIFPNENSFEKFVKQMKKIEDYTEFKRRISKRKTDIQDEDEKIFYSKMLLCLSDVCDKNQEKMYECIRSFDIHKKIFTK